TRFLLHLSTSLICFLFFSYPFFFSSFFFFTDTPTTEIYTLSLHDALPISGSCRETISAAASFTNCMSMRAIRQSICPARVVSSRSEEHTSELQSRFDLVCRLLLEKKKKKKKQNIYKTKTNLTYEKHRSCAC